jgi:hypothetical protein
MLMSECLDGVASRWQCDSDEIVRDKKTKPHPAAGVGFGSIFKD